MEEQRIITERYRQLQKQIRSQKKGMSEEEMSKLEVSMADFYYLYARYHFVIAYYNFYERYVAEEEGMLTKEAEQFSKELFPLIHTYRTTFKDNVNNSETVEELVKKTEALRLMVIRHMECIGAYTDRFTLFEYILNRLEKNFEDDKTDFDNEEAAKEIVQAVFSNQDNNAVNLKIQMMLSQLPVRITKAKYYQIMEDCMNLYEGAEISSVEKFIYMVRSAAGIYRPDQMEKLYPELEKGALILAQTEFRKLSKDDYDEKCGILAQASDFLNVSAECYMDIQEMINHFYVMNLLQDVVDDEIKEQGKLLDSIFDFVDDCICDEEEELVPEELLEDFEQLEGILEQINEAVELAGNYVTEVLEDTLEEELKKDVKLIKQLDMSRKLISSSVFVRLDEEDEIELADKEYLQNRFEALKNEFEDLFIRNNAKVNRAVMAAVLKEFPTFFTSGKEVMSYVQYSLENCKDMSEKKVSFGLLMDTLTSLE